MAHPAGRPHLGTVEEEGGCYPGRDGKLSSLLPRLAEGRASQAAPEFRRYSEQLLFHHPHRRRKLRMALRDIEVLVNEAASLDEPTFPPPSKIAVGGVDPLGLRQVNFDLMDKVLPGLNNVARHLRPFVVVAWACRRAREIAGETGFTDALVDDILDFVDRIEVIYSWSQFLH